MWDIEELLNLKDPVTDVDNFMSIYDFKIDTRLVLLSLSLFEEKNLNKNESLNTNLKSKKKIKKGNNKNK